MKFDLDAIDTKTLADEGVDMVVKKIGSDEPLLARNNKPVTLTLLGPDSDVYREQTRAQVRKRLLRTTNKPGGGFSELDLLEADGDALDLMVACTVGWKNVLDTDGKPVEFSRDAVRALYTGYPVVREQADAFIVDRTRFIKASSAN